MAVPHRGDVSLIHNGGESMVSRAKKLACSDLDWLPTTVVVDERRHHVYVIDAHRGYVLRLVRPSGAKYEHARVGHMPEIRHIADYRMTVGRESGCVYVASRQGVVGIDPSSNADQHTWPCTEMCAGVEHTDLVFSDPWAHAVRTLRLSGDPTANKSTVLAGAWFGHADDVGERASFFSPGAMCCDARGNAYVLDNFRLRRIDMSGRVDTVECGDDDGGQLRWPQDGVPQLIFPGQLCIDGSSQTVFLTSNSRIFTVGLDDDPYSKLLSSHLAGWPTELTRLVAAYLPAVRGRLQLMGEFARIGCRAVDITSVAFCTSPAWIHPHASDTAAPLDLRFHYDDAHLPRASGAPAALLLTCRGLRFIIRLALS